MAFSAKVTWEGTETGFGAVFDTVTNDGGPKNGTFSECATAFLDNDDWLHGIGKGTYESTGKHRWSTKSIIEISDGRRIAGEGEDRSGRAVVEGEVIRDELNAGGLVSTIPSHLV